MFFSLSKVVVDVIHKHRITGEKSVGRVVVPITDMKHGVYEQKWHPVMYGKGTRTTKVGEIFLKILLHKEGLTKEQRRSSIQSNMTDLKTQPDDYDGNNSESGHAKPWNKIPNGGSTASPPSPRSRSSSSGSGGSGGGGGGGGGGDGSGGGSSLQMQIELETRLIAMEKSIAQVTEMMSNVVERIGSK